MRKWKISFSLLKHWCGRLPWPWLLTNRQIYLLTYTPTLTLIQRGRHAILTGREMSLRFCRAYSLTLRYYKFFTQAQVAEIKKCPEKSNRKWVHVNGWMDGPIDIWKGMIMLMVWAFVGLLVLLLLERCVINQMRQWPSPAGLWHLSNIGTCSSLTWSHTHLHAQYIHAPDVIWRLLVQ